MVSVPEIRGAGNYTELFRDPLFWKSLKITLYYTTLAVPLGMMVALLIAMLLNQRVPFLPFYRTLYYVPSITPAVAGALLWQWLLNPDFGIVNYYIFKIFRVRGPQWFFSEQWVIPSFAIMSLWGVGQAVVIFLASLQSVPTTFYEAATVDGAGPLAKFFRITIPMISPTILFLLVTGIIGSFQVFTPIFVITVGRGGPNYASLVYVLYLFQNAFRNFRMGYAAAQAWILFLVILLLTLLVLKISRSWVYYEAER